MIEIILSGLFWRLRGIIGWPGTLLFSLVQVFTLYPLLDYWSFLFGLFIMAGEPTGWKPKLILDNGDWKQSAILGARIGLIGAISVPLSTLIHLKVGEPRIPNSPKQTNLIFWSEPKQLLNWTGAWNEVYFGVISSLILQGAVWQS